MPAQKAKDLEVQGLAPSIVATDFDNEFDDVNFESDFREDDETKSIPFAQLCTTDVSLTRFSAMPDPSKDYPYGLFIPVPQAEKAGFTPDASWMLESPCLGGKVRKFGGNDATPGLRISPEGFALERVDLVADEAGDGHGVRCSEGSLCTVAPPGVSLLRCVPK